MGKTIANLDPGLTTALEEFKAVSAIKAEMAQEAYELQDAKTKAAIDRIHGTLMQHANGYITLRVGGAARQVKIESEYLGMNLKYLAVEIVKDLAFVGLKVANFKFPPSLCVNCGQHIVPEMAKPPKRAK